MSNKESNEHLSKDDEQTFIRLGNEQPLVSCINN